MTSLSLLEGVSAARRRSVATDGPVYTPLVRHWCRRGGLPEQSIEDLVQETFAAVVRGLPTFNKNPDEARPQGGSFRGWLRTIVGRKLIDFGVGQSIRSQAGGGTDATTARPNGRSG